MALMKFKRSAVPAKIPSIADLALGELAINTYDGKLFLKKNDGTEAIVEIGAGGGGGSGTVTSVSGTGSVSGLTLSGTVTTSGSLTLGGTLALTSGDITGGLGYTPYNASNPAGYTSNVGTVTSVSGTGTVNGLTLTGTVTSSGSLELGGTLSGIDLSSQITGTLAIVNGGTGATTAINARSNLGAAASGANADITSLTGITGGISSPDFVQFDTTATVTPATGRLYFNDGEGGLSYTLKGGNVVQEVGQSQQVLVYNGTGAALTKGQVVYTNGAQGQRPTVALALATGDATSARTLGIVAEAIADGAEGWVTSLGIIENIDTSAFTAGAQLYLSGTTAGGLTATKPVAPLHMVYVARCIKSHATSGRLFVTVQNGYELDELHDVSAVSPANNDGIFYNTSTSLWEKKSIVTALGYTPYNATNPDGYITSSALSPYALLSGAAFTGNVTTTGNVGIGTTSPSSKLQLSGAAAGGAIQGTITNTDATGFTGFSFTDGTNTKGQFWVGNGSYGSFGGAGSMNYSANSGPHVWYTNYSERMRIDASGNLGIGTSSPAAKLDVVVGDGAEAAKLRGATGRMRVRPYVDATNGSFIDAVNTAENAYIPLSLAGSAIRLTTNNGLAATIDSSGNVGIGTSSFTNTVNNLVVRQNGTGVDLGGSSSTGAIRVRGTSGGAGLIDFYPVSSDPNSSPFYLGRIVYDNASNFMSFATNSTERMRIGPNGCVAIGGTATDATLHITAALGGFNRLTQMAPSGTSKDAFNIMAAKNSGGSDLWWSWGVDTSNRWRINQGVGFANNGVIMDDVGQITSADVAAAFGYKGLPQNQRTSAYTLALSDIGKHLYVTAGAFAVTIPADGTLNFPVGATMSFVCEDAAKTIVPASGVALVLAGTGAATTGTRTLAIGAVATLIKVQANRWYISGAGVT